MGVVTYVAMVGLSLGIGYAVTKLDPVFVGHASRQFGLTRAKGWALFVAAVLWTFLPLLAGAGVGDGEIWLVGAAVAGGGFYLAGIAASSLDEHRLLRRATVVEPTAVAAGTNADLVATTGIPSVPDGEFGDATGDADEESTASTPFSALPAVHTDWLVQRRRRVGLRETWGNVASGVESAPFTLGDGRIHVAAGDHRVFSGHTRVQTVGPNEPLPASTADVLRAHDVREDPADREKKLQLVEEFVPADDPVTVVGVPRQHDEPGHVVIDHAPPDRLLGTHRDYATTDTHTDGVPDGTTDAEPVLIAGDVDDARSHLRKRVRWLGTAGLAMIVGGQVLALWLAPGTPL